MNYIELQLHIDPKEPYQDIVMAELAELGFESFEESEDSLLAYIQQPLFNEEALEVFNQFIDLGAKIEYSHKLIEDQNWNAVWESNYEPILIDERCYIRAPFHPEMPEVEFQLLIEPQMSFGTAHHETTANMISLLLKEDVKGKSFLDMGCGTAVLAILAHKKGAHPICAIDNDEWAYRNSIDNFAKNNISDANVFLGDAALLEGKKFDVIFANINKNILLADIKHYAKSLNKKGELFMSGFYESDLEDIKAEAQKYELSFVTQLTTNQWVAAAFQS